MKTITVICGPTASGKSALAVDLARSENGVIINADSMQIYDALPILTARPSPSEQGAIAHHLYGTIPPDGKCSAQDWRDRAVKIINTAHENGHHPVVVGGTGLYLKALTHGLSAMPDIPPEIRVRGNALQAQLGNPGFHAALAACDPVMAARLNPNDTQRLIRAWEVFTATGRSLSAWQAEAPITPPGDWAFRIIIKTPPRVILHARCDERFDQMIDNGAIDEVAALKSMIASGDVPADAPVTHALGFRPLADFLDGLSDRDEAVARAKAETRQYAKRQDTWFRHQIKPAQNIEEIRHIP